MSNPVLIQLVDGTHIIYSQLISIVFHERYIAVCGWKVHFGHDSIDYTKILYTEIQSIDFGKQ